ncbi:MAG TPA: metallophosphoesterase [Gemmataceae bacterium]|nr:metallophosphoesterase [Gemmataceae bacterium]
MKRALATLSALTMILTAIGLTGSKKAPESTPPASNAIQADIEERNPWTSLELNDSPDDFYFAVISDRTGAERKGIFPKAVAQLNLLQPKFVLSVGDLIEGYSESAKDLNSEWDDLERQVRKLHMPFFFVAGNHDISNRTQEKHWRKRFGRRYYSFTYRGVLFLMLNSDDPPQKGGGLGAEQIAWTRKVLSANQSARWIFVVLHRPLWNDKNGNDNGWADVERLLDARTYTVFAGHEHRYQRFVRRGMNYYQLATTGGGSTLRGPKHGESDHFAWVTMKKDGPVVANVLLDGVLSDTFAAVGTP